jgi:membrane-associated phospholipid phosphatase
VSRPPTGLLVVPAGLAVIAACGIALGRIITGPAAVVVARDIDTPVRDFVTRPHDHVWHDLLAHVSAFGTASVTAAIAGLAGLLWWRRLRNPMVAVQLATAFAGAAMLTIVVKFGVNRDPVSGPIAKFAAGTFPSGHTLFAVSVYGMIGALVLRSSAPRVVGVPVAAVLAGLTLAVGWSRVYLLDHYASDVVGSVLIGVAWVVFVLRATSPT